MADVSGPTKTRILIVAHIVVILAFHHIGATEPAWVLTASGTFLAVVLLPLERMVDEQAGANY